MISDYEREAKRRRHRTAVLMWLLGHEFISEALVDFGDPKTVEKLRGLLKAELESRARLRVRRVKFNETTARAALVGSCGHDIAQALCDTIHAREKEDARTPYRGRGRHEDGWM